MTGVEEPSFTPDLFAFLSELKANNDRDWFKANKARYEAAVREPALAFVEDVGHLLPDIDARFVADTRANGGSMFRIHRDTRFAKDKTPYKTHTGIQFRPEGTKGHHVPCFYVHLEPGNVFVGCGSWRPDAQGVRQIRDAIGAHPDRWVEVSRAPELASRFRFGGDSLKRPPAGFDAGHPLIEDLKRKDFIVIADLDERTATAPGFLATFAELASAAAPFVGFICDAARVPA